MSNILNENPIKQNKNRKKLETFPQVTKSKKTKILLHVKTKPKDR